MENSLTPLYISTIGVLNLPSSRSFHLASDWLPTLAPRPRLLPIYWSVLSPRPPHPRDVTGAGRARSSASTIAEHCAILACKNNPDYRVSKKMFHLSQSWQQDFQEWKVNKNVYLVLFEERKYFCSIQQSTL